MKDNNIVQIKSYDFAIHIVKLYQYMISEHKEYSLSKQILRSGTSVGANVEEAIGTQSNKDFISKMTIAYKETRESHYWLRLLTDTGYIPKEKSDILKRDCEELLKITGSIIKTIKSKINS